MPKEERVLVLFDGGEPLSLDYDYTAELATPQWQTEADVIQAIRKLDYELDLLGVHNQIELIGRKIEAFRPTVIFNLVEEFKRNIAGDAGAQIKVNVVQSIYQAANLGHIGQGGLAGILGVQVKHLNGGLTRP